MPQTRTLIAVLDDEAQMRKALRRLLQANGFEVDTHASGSELLESHAVRHPACLVLDLHMPGMGGFDVLEALVSTSLAFPVIVITGHDAPGTAERALASGASAFLLKPIDESTLLATIDRVLNTGG